jgi:hypothetical protein
MDERFRKNLGRLARDAEVKLARSVLRWKYKKEDKPIPIDDQLECESRYVTNRAHEIIAKRGQNVWTELKKAYHKGDQKKEREGD